MNNLVQRACELAPIGLLVCDEDGLIAWANRSIRVWFGYELEDLLQRPVEVLIPDGNRSDHVSHRARYIAHPTSRPMGQNQVLIAKRKDGSLFSVDISLQPFQYLDRQYVLASLTNKKDRRQVESERHIDLSSMRNRLAKSERLAAVGQMMKGLAHETHNSLQRAISSLDLLELDFNPDSEQKELAIRVRAALGDLHQTYREVERYASPLHVTRTEISLRQVIRESFDSVTNPSDEHTIEMEGAASDLRADPVQLRVLFENVIENAIDAAVGAAKVHVILKRLEVGGKSGVQIEFRDHSGGVSKDALNQITDPFYTTKQQGTGLGLAICKRIAEAHGGRLDVKNHDKGLAVVLTLPEP